MRGRWWILGLLVVLGVLALLLVETGRLPRPLETDRSPLSSGPREPPPAEPDEAEADDTEVTITGRVVRDGSRAPVAGAEVVLEQSGRTVAETTSRPDGRFRLRPGRAWFAGLPPDGPVLVILRLRARAEGTTTLRAIPPDAGLLASTDLGDLVLRPAWTVHGTVRGEEGEPVARARIEFEPAEPDPDAASLAGSWNEVGRWMTVESDAEGRFRLEGVSRRSFTLEVVAPRYVTGWFSGSVRGEGSRLDLRLRRGLSVRVRVEDGEGRPVSGARVNLYPGYRKTFVSDYPTLLRLDRSVTTDPDGRALLTGLAERNYQVTADAPGLGSADTYLLAGWSEVVLRLRPDGTSRRYAYEDGPGRHVSPPGTSRLFPWVHGVPSAFRPPPSRPARSTRTTPDPEPDPEPVPEEERKPPPDVGRVRVRILSADGRPIPDVHVRLEGAETDSDITEEDGVASLSLSPGRYDLLASPLDFGTDAGDVRRTMDVAGGVVTRLDLTMPRVHSVRVEVRDVDGYLLPRVRLEILRGEEDEREWVGRDGTIRLFAERGEPFSLLAMPGGHPVAFLPSVEVPADGPVVLRVPPRRELRGRVLDPTGTPLFGARVAAEREGLEPLGEEVWRAWTDDAGRFTLIGPTIGGHRVSAHHAAYGAASTRVEVTAENDPLILGLRPLARARGRLTDREGRGVSGAWIEVQQERGGRVGSATDGAFEILLPPGDEVTSIRVRHEDFIPATVHVAGPAEDLEVRLSRGVELTLKVRCRNGLRFDVAFEDPASGERLLSGGGERDEEDGGVVWRWSHAPDGAVRVRLSPREGEARVLDYSGREGEAVVLETTIP